VRYKNRDDKIPPYLKRWKVAFDKRPLEYRIKHYERILSELTNESKYPLHHISNYGAALHWMQIIIYLRMEKIIKNHGEL
jgi:hypothetical protein